MLELPLLFISPALMNLKQRYTMACDKPEKHLIHLNMWVERVLALLVQFSASRTLNVLRNCSFSSSRVNYASLNNWVIKVVHFVFQLFYSTILALMGDFF